MQDERSEEGFDPEVDTARITIDEDLTRASVAGPRDCGVITLLAGRTPGLLYTLERPRTVIGRGSGADILISDPGISRAHVAITREIDGYYLHDLSSTNGTTLDGEPVNVPARLPDGARIGLGRETVLGFGLRDQMEQAAAKKAHDLAMRDPLTGLYNRRHLSERLEGELAFVQRHGGSISVLMVDIDRFKAINDDYGHAVGDHVLRRVAEQLAQVVRREDVLSRYGGEEFLIIARGIDEAGARAFGERIRRSMASITVPVQERRPITTSVGIAHAEGNAKGIDAQVLVQVADASLYAAKHAGRNRVEFCRANATAETVRQPPPAGT